MSLKIRRAWCRDCWFGPYLWSMNVHRLLSPQTSQFCLAYASKTHHVVCELAIAAGMWNRKLWDHGYIGKKRRKGKNKKIWSAYSYKSVRPSSSMVSWVLPNASRHDAFSMASCRRPWPFFGTRSSEPWVRNMGLVERFVVCKKRGK